MYLFPNLIKTQMKIKINKKAAKDIEQVKLIIKASDEFQESLITRIGDELGLQTDEEREILWDHIYNESDWMVEKE